MKKFELLLLDANVVIYLFDLGIWEKLVEKCNVHLSRTVAEQEALFHETEEGRCPIDLRAQIDSGRITIVDAAIADVAQFRDQFDPTYLDRLDPGETESLIYLVNATEQYLICSADSIVFKVLAQLGRSEQGVSLEEILNAVGLGRNLEGMFTKSFRDRWTKIGGQERIQGLGLMEGKRLGDEP
jgi:hypothetical protein